MQCLVSRLLSGCLWVNYKCVGGVSVDVSENMKVPDTVYSEAGEIADEKDMTMKEAVRMMCREGGYDV